MATINMLIVLNGWICYHILLMRLLIKRLRIVLLKYLKNNHYIVDQYLVLLR